MLKPIVFCVLFAAVSTVHATTTIVFNESSDIALTLSQTNFNRLVVKQDKIMEAYFPKGAMDLQHDEQDGSIYIIPASNTPFTLFLTTATGRHLTLTVNTEEALGKTIELAPIKQALAKANPAPVKPPLTPEQQASIALITQMEQHKPQAGVVVKRHFGKVERWQQGIVLRHKESWQSPLFIGELIEVVNGGRAPIQLERAWFSTKNSQALKLSQETLAPKQTALLYRIRSAQHG